MQKYRSYLILLHVAVLLLGMTGLFGKFIPLSPLVIIAGRSFFTVVFVICVLLVLKQSLSLQSWQNGLWLWLSGAVISFHWYAFFHAIQLSTVAIGVIGLSTYPIFVTFLEPLLFRETLKIADVASGIVVCIGLLFVVPDFSFANTHTVALAWAVLAGFVAALFTLMSRKLTQKNHYLVITLYQHLFALICTLPFVAWYSLWPETKFIWMLAVLGVIFTAIPQAMFTKGLKVVKAQLVSVLVGLEPVYSIIFAIVLLEEIPTSGTIIGGIIILIGVAVASVSHNQHAKRVSDEATKTSNA